MQTHTLPPSPPPRGNQLLTAAEKAAELKITTRTLAAWRKARKIKHVSFSSRVIRYYPEPAIG
jgi:hypothetical protein